MVSNRLSTLLHSFLASGLGVVAPLTHHTHPSTPLVQEPSRRVRENSSEKQPIAMCNGIGIAQIGLAERHRYAAYQPKINTSSHSLCSGSQSRVGFTMDRRVPRHACEASRLRSSLSDRFFLVEYLLVIVTYDAFGICTIGRFFYLSPSRGLSPSGSTARFLQPTRFRL
jgi:hypothetical protein